MYRYTIAQWLLFFFFYCFVGWCFESAYVSLKKKTFVNRGFMSGPFLPLYGSGAVMMLVVSAPFRHRLAATYIAGMIGATVLEYVTGVVMEALFHVRYWDYSNQRFQYKGYICLSSSVTWGFFTLLLTQVIHKPVEMLICGLPHIVSVVLAFVISVLALDDFVLSFKAAIELKDVLARMEQVREEIEKAKGELARLQKRVNEMVAPIAQESAQKKEQLEQWLVDRKEQISSMAESAMQKLWSRRIVRGNPGMVSSRFAGGVEELKRFALRKRKNGEKKTEAASAAETDRMAEKVSAAEAFNTAEADRMPEALSAAEADRMLEEISAAEAFNTAETDRMAEAAGVPRADGVTEKME